MKTIIKRNRFLVFCLLWSMIGAKGFADSWYYSDSNNISYIINRDNGTASVTSRTINGHNTYSGSITIPDKLYLDGMTYDVTGIEAKAFLFSDVTSLNIPSSVINIGAGAFEETPWYNNQPNGMVYAGLVAYHYKGQIPDSTEIILKDGTKGIAAEAFVKTKYYNDNSKRNEGQGGLISVVIPNSVVSIGGGAFKGCWNLTSINIPKNVLSISSPILSGDVGGISRLTTISVNEENPIYDSRNNCNAIIETATNKLIQGCQTTIIPYSIEKIGVGAFEGQRGLTSITIPNSVTTIGGSAFAYCRGLTSITIPNSVTTIGASALFETEWYNNQPDGLVYAGKVAYQYKGTMPEGTQISLRNGTTGIADYTFYSCKGLASITIPNSVIIIGESAFLGCSGLTSITIPDNVMSIGRYAFDNTGWYNNLPDGLVYAGKVAYNYKGTMPNNTQIIIEEGTTGIADYAFSYCTGLTSITIPNSVKNIEKSSFNGCNKLKTLNLNCWNIGDWFSDMSQIESLTLGKNVSSINSDAFSSCKLHNVFIKRNSPPSLDNNSTFSAQTLYHAMLYVPAGSWDAYAYHKRWYEFINIRETATTEEQVSAQLAYTLMDANSFAYSVYDPVNDCIGTVNSVSGIDENNPNHSWQMIEANGVYYLYNIGAKKYVKRNGNGLDLTDMPVSIDVEDGDNGLILGAQPNNQWALVSNERMSVAQSAIDEVTGIVSPISSIEWKNYYDVNGRRIDKPQKGINVLRKSDGSTRKVLVK